MSICEAAETFGIPRSTLGNKLHGKSAQTVTVREKAQCFQRLLKIGKKNFGTYIFILFV